MDNNFNNNMPGAQPGMPVDDMPQTSMPTEPEISTEDLGDGITVAQPEAPKADMAAPIQPGAPMGMGQSQMGNPMGMPMTQMPMGQPQMGGMSQQPIGQAPMGMGQPLVGMSQYGQPQMGQAPMGMNQMPMGGTMQPAVKPKKQKAPKVKKPLTGGKIAAIIGGSVALIALIVCGIIFIPKLFKPAKDVVVDAFENTFATTVDKDDESYMEDVIGINEMNETFSSTGGEINTDITLLSVAGVEAPYLMTAGINAKIDYVGKLANTTIFFDVDDTNVATLNIIGNETDTYLQLQDIIDGYFTLPNENILIALQDSPLGQELGLYDMPEFTMDYFGTVAETTEINSDAVSAVETLWDKVEVEKEGKAKIEVNGEKVTAKEYVVTFPEDALKDSLESLVDSIFTDEYLAEYAATSGMTAEELQTTVDTIKSLIPTLVQDDLVAKVYIKDDKVVKITSEGDTNIYGVTLGYETFLDVDDEQMSGEFVLDLMGEKMTVSLDIEDMNTAPKMTFVIDAAGEVMIIDIALSKENTDTNESILVDMSLEFDGSDIFYGSVSMDIDKTDNSFDGSFNMYMDETVLSDMGMSDMGEIEVVFEGEYTDINKGVSYTQKFDNIECFIDGESMVSMSATYYYGAGAVDVTGIDTSLPVYDLTTVTSDDLADVFGENADNIANWSENIINNTGEFGQEISDLMAEEEPEDDYYDDYDDYDTEVSFDDAILYGYNADVKINGTISGFYLESATSLWIGFTTDNYGYATVYLYEDYTVEEVLSFYSLPTEEDGYTIYEGADNQQVTLADGSTVYYSYVQYDSYGSVQTVYTMAREVEPGIIVNIDVSFYDDYETYTVEQLAEMLSDTNITVTTY